MDLDEGLEEALGSLSMNHVTQVRCHVTKSHTSFIMSPIKGSTSTSPGVQTSGDEHKGIVGSCDCHTSVM